MNRTLLCFLLVRPIWHVTVRVSILDVSVCFSDFFDVSIGFGDTVGQVSVVIVVVIILGWLDLSLNYVLRLVRLDVEVHEEDDEY